jgi:hypothetical protein
MQGVSNLCPHCLQQSLRRLCLRVDVDYVVCSIRCACVRQHPATCNQSASGARRALEGERLKDKSPKGQKPEQQGFGSRQPHPEGSKPKGGAVYESSSNYWARRPPSLS